MMSTDLAQVYTRADKNVHYVRTDKNGTEIYADYTCRKCGGVGGADQWTYTGWTCYSCGGTGKSDKPQLIKKYTPEYEAKLKAMREKRAEKAKAKRIEDLNSKLQEMLELRGFSGEGKIYAVTGDTYSLKDELREAGAKWKQRLNCWTFAEPSTQYPTVEIGWEEVLVVNYEEGYLEWKDFNPKEFIQSKLPKEDKPVSEHVGEIGKRIELKATLESVRHWEVPAFRGWGTDTKTLYKFRDEHGNILIWITTGYGLDASEVPVGAQITLRGTVANHSEYAEEKQTELKRCTIKK